MFIGARVAYVRAGVARFGVVIKDNEDFSYLVKLDDLTEITVPDERLTLINYWKTLKRGMDVGDYKTFPKNTDPKTIFMSKKAVIFGQAGMRSVWHYYNHLIFNNRMKEPKFLVTKGRKFGRFIWGGGKPNTLEVSDRCHSLFEVTNTLVH